MKDLYAVIGNPVEHSLSPAIHEMFARQEGAEIEYVKVLSPLDGFNETVQKLVKDGVKGFNITVPFKEEAAKLGGKVSDEVKESGAANTVKVEGGDPKGWLIDNTDGRGLANDLWMRGIDPAGARTLIIGAGGAARGLIPVFKVIGTVDLTVANRSPQKLEVFKEKFKVATSSFEELEGTRWDLIINATSSALKGEAPNVPDSIFEDATLAYDLVYAKEPTPFMKKAQEKGVGIVKDGLGMLVEQAAIAYSIWRGFKPKTDEVLEAIRKG